MSLPWLKVPVCDDSSCHLVFLLHTVLYLQLHGLFNGTDTVQVIYLAEGRKASWSLEAAPSHASLYLQLHGLFNSTDAVQVIYERAEHLLGPLKQPNHMKASTCDSMAYLMALTQSRALAEGRTAS